MTSWPIRAITIAAGAGAMPAAAQPTQAAASPSAQVEAHALTRAGDGLTVRVPTAATYAGGDRFVLYGVADCEIHVFVEADAQRHVRRLYWVQFEAYLPSRPEARYNYVDGNRRIELGGIPTWVRPAPA